jgi:hypothetical protein
MALRRVRRPGPSALALIVATAFLSGCMLFPDEPGDDGPTTPPPITSSPTGPAFSPSAVPEPQETARRQPAEGLRADLYKRGEHFLLVHGTNEVKLSRFDAAWSAYQPTETLISSGFTPTDWRTAMYGDRLFVAYSAPGAAGSERLVISQFQVELTRSNFDRQIDVFGQTPAYETAHHMFLTLVDDKLHLGTPYAAPTQQGHKVRIYDYDTANPPNGLTFQDSRIIAGKAHGAPASVVKAPEGYDLLAPTTGAAPHDLVRIHYLADWQYQLDRSLVAQEADETAPTGALRESDRVYVAFVERDAEADAGCDFCHVGDVELHVFDSLWRPAHDVSVSVDGQVAHLPKVTRIDGKLYVVYGEAETPAGPYRTWVVEYA